MSDRLSIVDLNEAMGLLEFCNFSSHKWFQMGIKLNLEHQKLVAIEKSYVADISRCLLECLNLWLREGAISAHTWNFLVHALSEIGEKSVADRILKITTCPASYILRQYCDKLLQVVLTEDTVQLLHTEKVVLEEVVIEVERYGRVLMGNPFIAVCVAVAEDPHKLKLLADILKTTDEAVPLADEITTAYEKAYPPTKAFTGFPEDFQLQRLRYKFGSVLHNIASLIQSKIPSIEDLKSFLRRCRPDKKLLLKQAYSFDDVMDIIEGLCSTTNIIVLEEIVKQYKIEEATDYLLQMQRILEEISAINQDIISSTQHAQDPVIIPFSQETVETFEQMRYKLGKLLHNVALLIQAKIPSIEDLKTLLQRWRPEIKYRVKRAESFDNVMEIIEEKCSIINIVILEEIIDYYEIRAECLASYQKDLEEFCSLENSLNICNNKQLYELSLLKCETIKFTLNWKAQEHTLKDIRDFLTKAFRSMANRVEVVIITEGNSISFTCYAPRYLMGSLQHIAEENLNQLKKEGLVSLTIGYNTVLDKDTSKLQQSLKAQKEKTRRCYLQLDNFLSSQKSLENEKKELQNILLIFWDLIKPTNQVGRLQLVMLANHGETFKNTLALNDKEDFTVEEKVSLVTKCTPFLAAELKHTKRGDKAGTVDIGTQRVWLINPSPQQCLEVVTRLNKSQERIDLTRSSDEIANLLLPHLLKRATVKEVIIHYTLLSSESILSLSLSTNCSLQVLNICHSSIRDDGVAVLCKSLLHNTTLITLDISKNPDITDDCVPFIEELLLTNVSLANFSLCGSSISSKESICVLLNALMRTTKSFKYLSINDSLSQACFAFEHYADIRQKLSFV